MLKFEYPLHCATSLDLFLGEFENMLFIDMENTLLVMMESNSFHFKSLFLLARVVVRARKASNLGTIGERTSIDTLFPQVRKHTALLVDLRSNLT